MRILALVAARGESKRIVGKNLKLLGGRPLVAWSIASATRVPELCDVLMSTDDTAIADVARNAGALVPWLRPAELSTDHATAVDVALHALDWYERNRGMVDGLLLLQPTSPFRRDETILRGVDLFRRNPDCTVLGMSPASSHPMWTFRIEDGLAQPFLGIDGLRLRSQDLPSAYVVNGGFYLIAPNLLRQQRSFYHGKILPLIFNDAGEDLDIDTEADWKVAESLL